MNEKSLIPSPSRRDLIKKASAAAAAASFPIFNSSHVSAKGSGLPDQVDSGESAASRPALNCAQTVLARANDLYKLELKPGDLSFASAFGGGMGIGDKCGTVTGSLMVLGYLFKGSNGDSASAKKASSAFIKAYESRMDSLDCRDLRVTHRTETGGCEPVISAALEVLDATINQHSKTAG